MTTAKRKSKDKIACIEQPSVPPRTQEECEKRLREISEKILTGKCPIRVIERNGEILWDSSIFREPNSNIYDTLKKLTATTDSEIAAEIMCKGSNAMPNKSEFGRNTNIVLQSLADSEPKDATEARFCAQSTVLYSQGMQYLSRAEGADMLCHKEFYMKCAIKLLRLHNETIEALNKYRRGGEQRCVVLHVHVNDGGKAVVGGVFNEGGGEEKSAEVIPC